jgi:hypothetical protein
MGGVTVTATESIPGDQVAAVERQVAAVVRSAGEVTGTQLTLRRDADRASREPFVADVIAFRAGRVIAAHAVGASPLDAGEAVAAELRRRLRRAS